MTETGKVISSAAEPKGGDTEGKEKDSEEKLLESLGASIEDQDVYEDEVIRNATHQLAPCLTGIGFPSLEDLAPGHGIDSPSANLPLFHAVLRKVRGQVESDVRQMKEQMLLVYLSNCTKEELPLDPVQELRMEERRARIERKRAHQTAAVHGALASSGATQNGSPEGQPRLASSRAVKRRKTMMSQKTIGKVDCEEIREKVEKLKEIRRERQRRKEERRKEIFGENDDYSISSNSDSEIETEFNDGVLVERGRQEESSGGNDVSGTETSLHCPICTTGINIEAGEDKDEVLARHVALCQTRRPSRSTSRNVPPAKQARTSRTKISPSTPRKKRARNVNRRYCSVSIDDISEVSYEDRVDDWIQNGIQCMREMKERDVGEDPPGSEEYEEGLFVPAWINDRLFAYQRTGLKWLWKLHLQQCGGIVGDQMGLGKTVQVSSYLGILAASRMLKSVLLVVPATMLQHWLTELARWAPGLRRILIHPSAENDGVSRTITDNTLSGLSRWLKRSRRERLYEAIDDEDIENQGQHAFVGCGYVVITTYANLRQNTDVYMRHAWSYFVIDEAQTVRNPDADITLACKRIKTPHRIALTGTPIQNDLRELWSLFDFVHPGLLGTLPVFEQEFAEPIKRGGYKNASPMQVQLAYRCALTLKSLIGPYMLRREKKDVKETQRMPAKKELVMLCRLSGLQRQLYEAYLRSDEVMRVRRGSAQLLAAITTLRKICNHPDLVCDPDQSSVSAFIRNRGPTSQLNLTDSDDDESVLDDLESLVARSGKLELLSRILPSFYEQGHRVLIFCQWRKTLNIIQRFCVLNGWKFGRLDGNTSVPARQRLVDKFNQDDSYFLMLCTTRTGGVGLNLTGANRVILFSPDWNPQNDAQARERAWRFGQEKEVRIYRFITAGTVEEKIYHRQIFKSALSNTILQDPKQKRLFSQQQLKDLFTLKTDSGSFRDGGEGVTETGMITGGSGVIEKPVEGDSKDSNETLKQVMRSRGLAGIFDHDVLEEDSSQKNQIEKEREEHAREYVKNAVKSLRQSVESLNPFEPTYTGGEATFEPKRFGSTGYGKASSSTALLSSLRNQQHQAKTAARIPPGLATNASHIQLVEDIKRMLRNRSLTTDEIMNKFSDEDPQTFGNILRSIASMSRDGYWRLKR